MTQQWADIFAQEWIGAWNTCDLDRVLSHYTDDFEMSSPLIIQIIGEASGMLRGKERITTYWKAALQRHPGLHFDLLGVFIGASSLVIHYRTNLGRVVAEVLYINADGLAYRAAAHHLISPS